MVGPALRPIDVGAPDDNPCFVCGPANPVGLRLALVDDGEWIGGAITLDARHAGAAGSAHRGVVWAALFDVAEWAARERLGAPCVAEPTTHATFLEGVRTSDPLVVRARLAESDAPWAVVEALAEQDARLAARMVARFRPLTKEERARAADRTPAPTER